MTSLLAVMVVATVAVATLRLAARALVSVPTPYVAWPWQSGHLPAEHALSRYHARWYTASVVFLAFDVEMLFMYPWAVVVADMGAGAVVEMFAFLGALLLAVWWAAREGAFRWA